MELFGRAVFGRPAADEAGGKGAEAEDFDKSKMVEFGCNCSAERERGTTAQVGRLQRELANSYYWSGNICTDFLFFVSNWHPLLGLFCSHPAHPWRKKDRLATFILSVALSFLPSALLVSVSSHTERTDVQLLSGWMVFVVVTLPIMIWEIALYWVVISDSFCKGRCDMMLPCVSQCKKCCFMASLFVTAFLVLIAMMIVLGTRATAYKVFLPVATSRVQSWIVWFPIWIFLPYLGFLHYWRIERREALQVHSELA
mmetsp:Transcript_14862/g.42630  ORF Transcript_14862/g.42630 Transcript_14862/m.42630 type:complete len:256 (-) Transcript_14862:69-836(-)